MAGNFHKDSQSGDISGISQTEPTHTIDGKTLLNDTSDPLNRTPSEKSKLPVSKTGSSGSINWLGSSYSGTDIKVVAHLYENYGSDDEVSSLKNERDIFSSIEDGASSLLDSLNGLVVLLDPFSELTHPQKREAFQKGTGLDPQDPAAQQAISFLTSQLFDGANFSLGGIARIRVKTSHIYQDYKNRREQADIRLKELELIKESAEATVVLGSLQTMSIQTHREKVAVRACGHSYAKGYTRGPRTIAGSMIFTVFNEHVLLPLMRSMSKEKGIWKNAEISTLLPDQLPPLDITLAFANEYGSLSELRVFGLEFANDGITMSIEDLLTEQIMNFVARDCDVMTSHGNVLLSRLQRGGSDDKETSGSSLLFNNERYNRYLDKIGVRRRLLNR